MSYVQPYLSLRKQNKTLKNFSKTLSPSGTEGQLYYTEWLTNAYWTTHSFENHQKELNQILYGIVSHTADELELADIVNAEAVMYCPVNTIK
jgi:hypothetical protein